MPQKIKILGLNKPSEYIKNELTTLKAKQYKMLSSSDWTQLPDAYITAKNVIEWRFWRNSIRLYTITDIDFVANNERLELLEAARPTITKRTNEFFKYILSDFNYSSTENFKRSCILILHEIGVPVTKQDMAKINKSQSIEEAYSNLLSLL